MRWQQQTDHRSGETELRSAVYGYCRALLELPAGLWEEELAELVRAGRGAKRPD